MKNKHDPLRGNLALLKEVEAKLKSAHIASARFEAEVFVRHFSKMDRVELFTGKKVVSPAARKAVAEALKKRTRGIPLQHLLKEAHFFGHSFYVSKDVLIPRPETEILAEEALKAAQGKKAPKILDLGTGSGCLAISLTIERPECKMTASDISHKALRVAHKNSSSNKLRKKIHFIKSDLFEAFEDSGEKWDVIVSNPPYIPTAEIRALSREVRSEPRLALDGGKRGLDMIERILRKASKYLEPGGALLMEIGKGQSATLRKKYPSARFVKDHTGIERILIVQKNGLAGDPLKYLGASVLGQS